MGDIEMPPTADTDAVMEPNELVFRDEDLSQRLQTIRLSPEPATHPTNPFKLVSFREYSESIGRPWTHFQPDNFRDSGMSYHPLETIREENVPPTLFNFVPIDVQNSFAVVSIDPKRIVVVMRSRPYWRPLTEGWETDAIQLLNRHDIDRVFCNGDYTTLRGMAPGHTTMFLNYDDRPLKYPCKICDENCAFTKGHLTFRKIWKREKFIAMHDASFGLPGSYDPSESDRESPLPASDIPETLFNFIPIRVKDYGAVVSIDGKRVVMETRNRHYWRPSTKGWERDTIGLATYLNISNVFCNGNYKRLEVMAPSHMNVCLNHDGEPLRWRCRICNEKCAFTKSHLTFRKIYKRQPVDMMHDESFA